MTNYPQNDEGHVTCFYFFLGGYHISTTDEARYFKFSLGISRAISVRMTDYHKCGVLKVTWPF